MGIELRFQDFKVRIPQGFRFLMLEFLKGLGKVFQARIIQGFRFLSIEFHTDF